MDFETILFDVSDHIATITFNRPERLNATNDTSRRELGEAWGIVRDDPEIRVAIITGAGDRAFSAGQDIRATAESGIHNKVPGSRLHHGVWKPVICALNGMVVGGGLHQVSDSDLIIAAEHVEILDTHCAVGNVFAMEPVGLLRRMPLSMVMQLADRGPPGAQVAHTRSTADPVSTSGPGIGTRQGGKPVIMLTSGGKIEADEVWRTKDGVWYRRNGMVTLLKRGQVKTIVTR